MTRKSVPPYDRLKKRLSPSKSGCLEFVGPVDKYGYPKMKTGSRERSVYHRAHRVAWEALVGPIPDELCVLHKCDNKRCCNVDHLYLGTRKENNRDKFYRAVGKHPLRHPTQISCAKRMISQSRTDIEVSFVTGLPERTVTNIRLGHCWS